MTIQTAEQVSRSVSKRLKTQKITFAAQAEKFVQDAANRKRKPLRQSSIRVYRSRIGYLVSLIGKIDLELISNSVVKQVVTKMAEEKSSARTIGAYVMIIKEILKSARDENGEQLYPRTWDADIIDAPVPDDTKQPIVTALQAADAILNAIKGGRSEDASLYAVLAGTGLRISEARAIKLIPDDGVSTVWVPDQLKIIVRQQMTRTGLGPVKTKAGVREIDICAELNFFMYTTWSSQLPRETGLVFEDSEDAYGGRMEKHGIAGGFHSFRRYRITYLRMAGVPDPLVKYWAGHAAGNVTEQYTQVAGQIESRREHAAKVGLGFKLCD